MKGLRSIALLLAAAFVFTGCNMIRVNTDRDGAQVVATVYGENITKKEVYDYAGLKLGQKVDSWDLENFKATKEQALDYMIEAKVIKRVAGDKGFNNFTDDEKKQIADFVTNYVKDTYDTALAKYQKQAKTDASIKPEEKANADVDAWLKEQGTSREELTQSESDYLAQQKLMKSITDPISPTDTDLQNEYSSELASEQTSYAADPAQAVTDDNGASAVAVAFPVDGYIRVRQILIPLPDEIQSQLSDYRYTNTAESNASADQLRTTELEKIKAKADEYLAKAKAAGGDLAKLDQLIKDAGNNDPGIDSKPEGYLVCTGTTYYWQAFTDAALALKDAGVPSELVATDNGYHIIWIAQKISKGTTVPFAQVKDKLMDVVKAKQQNTALSNAEKQWLDDADSQIHKDLDKLNN